MPASCVYLRTPEMVYYTKSQEEHSPKDKKTYTRTITDKRIIGEDKGSWYGRERLTRYGYPAFSARRNIPNKNHVPRFTAEKRGKGRRNSGTMPRRIKLTVQYDGSAYHGWQFQPSGLTIQGMLQECVYRLVGERVRVVGAGRTDAGVHAIEQVAAFNVHSSMNINVIKRALNALLPPDVRVMNIEEVTEDFHPRHSAKGKRYVYLIANMRDVPVFIRGYVWRVKEPLDLESMRAASSPLLGRHDFSSFRAAGCASTHPLRTIRRIGIERLYEAPFLCAGLKGEFVRITVEADAFLRHMVRAIVGTLVEVGKGKLGPEMVRHILEKKERRLAGPTAPPQGLFLDRIFYEPFGTLS